MHRTTQKRWLTKREAADHCGVKPRTIDNWRKRGLRAYVQGGIVRFMVRDLDSFLESGMEDVCNGEHRE